MEILHSLPSPTVERVIPMQKEVETTGLGPLVLITCGCAENTCMPGPDLPSSVWVALFPSPGLVFCQCLGWFRDSLLIANVFSSWVGLETCDYVSASRIVKTLMWDCSKLPQGVLEGWWREQGLWRQEGQPVAA